MVSFVALPMTAPKQFQFCEIVIFDMLAQLQKLDVRKATGPEGISACCILYSSPF